MGQEIPNKIILTIETSTKQFVRVMLDNITTDKIKVIPTKNLFYGTINESKFKLYRLKRFTNFDYNTTKFTGEIQPDNKLTNIKVDFSLIWIYRYILIITTTIFIIVNLFIYSTYNFTWDTLLVFIAGELLILGQLWFQNKRKLKTDKEKYIRILESIFGKVEIKNNR